MVDKVNMVKKNGIKVRCHHILQPNINISTNKQTDGDVEREYKEK